MPLQNRVTPFGDIIATPHRGMFTGNRGIIHDPATKTLSKRRWSSRAWLTCVCEFRGRRREVMGGRSWTELFFLDEATAFAAGHRPCFFCRREDANRFRAAWEKGNGASDLRADDIDAMLHRERLEGRGKRLHALAYAALQTARRRDGRGGRGQFSDREGQAAKMVAGRLSRGAGQNGECDAADATFDIARVFGRLPAGAASECEGTCGIGHWLCEPLH